MNLEIVKKLLESLLFRLPAGSDPIQTGVNRCGIRSKIPNKRKFLSALERMNGKDERMNGKDEMMNGKNKRMNGKVFNEINTRE